MCVKKLLSHSQTAAVFKVIFSNTYQGRDKSGQRTTAVQAYDKIKSTGDGSVSNTF